MFWEKDVPKMSKNIGRLQIQGKFIWKCLKEWFLPKLQSLNVQLCWKISSTTNSFQLTYLPFKNYSISMESSKKRVWILKCSVYSRCIVLNFCLLQLVFLTDPWSIFNKTRMRQLNGEHLITSAINKKEKETGKLQCGSSKWKV